MRQKGKLTTWNDDRGFGFITPLSGGKKVFVHVKAFGDRRRRPELGDMVSFSITNDRQGRPRATNARLAGDGLRQAKTQRTASAALAVTAIFFGIVGAAVAADGLHPLVLALYLGLSLITYVAYAMDKSAAKRGRWRTQESTLHVMALAGGWPGALIAQRRLRHKSRKQSFLLVFWLTVVLNLGICAWLFTPSGEDVLLNLFRLD